eukprot:gene13722-18408_t
MFSDLLFMSNELRSEREQLLSTDAGTRMEAFLKRESTLKYNDTLDEVKQSKKDALMFKRRAALIRLKRSAAEYRVPAIPLHENLHTFWKYSLSQEKKQQVHIQTEAFKLSMSVSATGFDYSSYDRNIAATNPLQKSSSSVGSSGSDKEHHKQADLAALLSHDIGMMVHTKRRLKTIDGKDDDSTFPHSHVPTDNKIEDMFIHAGESDEKSEFEKMIQETNAANRRLAKQWMMKKKNISSLHPITEHSDDINNTGPLSPPLTSLHGISGGIDPHTHLDNKLIVDDEHDEHKTAIPVQILDSRGVLVPGKQRSISFHPALPVESHFKEQEVKFASLRRNSLAIGSQNSISRFRSNSFSHASLHNHEFKYVLSETISFGSIDQTYPSKVLANAKDANKRKKSIMKMSAFSNVNDSIIFDDDIGNSSGIYQLTETKQDEANVELVTDNTPTYDFIPQQQFFMTQSYHVDFDHTDEENNHRQYNQNILLVNKPSRLIDPSHNLFEPSFEPKFDPLAGKWLYDDSITDNTIMPNRLLTSPTQIKKRSFKQLSNGITNRSLFPMNTVGDTFTELLFSPHKMSLIINAYRQEALTASVQVPIDSCHITPSAFPDMMTLRRNHSSVNDNDDYLGTFRTLHWIAIQEEIDVAIKSQISHTKYDQHLSYSHSIRRSSSPVQQLAYHDNIDIITHDHVNDNNSIINNNNDKNDKKRVSFPAIINSDNHIIFDDEDDVDSGLNQQIAVPHTAITGRNPRIVTKNNRELNLTIEDLRKPSTTPSLVGTASYSSADNKRSTRNNNHIPSDPGVSVMGYKAEGYAAHNQDVSITLYGLQPPVFAVPRAPTIPRSSTNSRPRPTAIVTTPSEHIIPTNDIEIDTNITTTVTSQLEETKEDESVEDPDHNAVYTINPTEEIKEMKIVLLVDHRRVMQLYFAKKFLQLDIMTNLVTNINDLKSSLLEDPEVYGLILISYHTLSGDSSIDSILLQSIPKPLKREDYFVVVYDVPSSSGAYDNNDSVVHMLDRAGVDNVMEEPYTLASLRDLLAAFSKKEEIISKFNARMVVNTSGRRNSMRRRW